MRQKVKRRRPGAGRRKRSTTDALNEIHESESEVDSEPLDESGRAIGLRARRRQQLLRQRRRRQRLRRRRQRLRNRRRRNRRRNRLSGLRGRFRRRRRNNRRRNQRRRNRIRNRRNAGGGRVEGLSKITRDGDAEMQLFGNYTLVRWRSTGDFPSIHNHSHLQVLA